MCEREGGGGVIIFTGGGRLQISNGGGVLPFPPPLLKDVLMKEGRKREGGGRRNGHRILGSWKQRSLKKDLLAQDRRGRRWGVGRAAHDALFFLQKYVHRGATKKKNGSNSAHTPFPLFKIPRTD